MDGLTTEQTNQLKEIVLHYLHGEALSVVSVLLQTQCAEFKISSKSLYKSITLENAQNDPFILAIFSSLNIKKSNPSAPHPYEKLLKKSNNLYDLLTCLYHDGYHHLGYLLRLIEHTKPKPNWAMVFIWGAVFSALLGSILYLWKWKEYIETTADWFIHSFPYFIESLGKTFSVLRNISLLALSYYMLGLLWNWYETFANGTTTTTDKLNSLVFKNLTYGLTILAYALSYVDSGAMGLFPAFLFVLGSSIDVFQSVFEYYRSLHALQTITVPPSNAEWEIVAEYERAKDLHQHPLQSVWVKLSAAILTTIAIAIWCFFPPSVIINTCCITFIALIGLAKQSIMNNYEEIYANNLQKNLRQIGTPIKPEYTPALKGTLARLSQQQRQLVIKEQELLEREYALSTRENLSRDISVQGGKLLNTNSPVALRRLQNRRMPTAPSRHRIMHARQANDDTLLDNEIGLSTTASQKKKRI
jgi:hypothetical protein